LFDPFHGFSPPSKLVLPIIIAQVISSVNAEKMVWTMGFFVRKDKNRDEYKKADRPKNDLSAV